MPKIKTITEYKRGYKTFAIGTELDVTWEKAKELADAGICEPVAKPKKKKVKKIKKVEEDGSNSDSNNN